ncbi:hypothetical protein ACFRCQ_15190 [Cytobacillus firmus]|uniref:hypothetical protein n=1 Tax=Cytobacillus firmus TaxID=1399 RepID=UPI0036759280
MTEAEQFISLWKSGYRFVGKEQEDDLKNCMKQEISPGVYEVVTIRGMKEMSKRGKLVFDGEVLSEDEIEFMWNALAFITRNKNKVN